MFGKQRSKSLDKIKVLFRRKGRRSEDKSTSDEFSTLEEISTGGTRENLVDDAGDHFSRCHLKQSMQKLFRSFRRTGKGVRKEKTVSTTSLDRLHAELNCSNSKAEPVEYDLAAGAASPSSVVQHSYEEAEEGSSDADSTKLDMCLVYNHAPVNGELQSPLPSVNGANASLTQELAKLVKYGWYWGPISRSEAVEKLSGHCDGAFLLRDSSDDHYLLSLSFRSFGRTFHTRIEHTNGLFSFYSQPELEAYTSVISLIEESIKRSEMGVFCYSRGRSPGSPSIPVRLTKPVSRFTQVRSLQYLCRFVIRQYIRYDHIQKLPLPQRIKGYLEEGHY